MAWWTGQNLLDVAIYINEARALQLTLIGGHTAAEVEGHDWERILTDDERAPSRSPDRDGRPDRRRAADGRQSRVGRRDRRPTRLLLR
jgi:hypothetical protein